MTTQRTADGMQAWRGTVVKRGRGMVEGLVYVESYLPFEPEAFAQFTALAAKLGSGKPDYAKAEKANAELARKALLPIDTHGECMVQEQVLKLAHTFVSDPNGLRIDLFHNERPTQNVKLVQSFVNTPEIESPHFWPGAWVTVLKATPGTAEFHQIESGELDAVSFQAVVSKHRMTVAAHLLQEGA